MHEPNREDARRTDYGRVSLNHWNATHKLTEFNVNDIERFALRYDYCLVTEKKGVLEIYVKHNITNSNAPITNGFHLKPVYGRISEQLNKVLLHGKILIEKGERPSTVSLRGVKKDVYHDTRPIYIKQGREWNENDYFIYGVFPPGFLPSIDN